MAHIATINGKAIYSDKQMKDVVNTRVTFTDGSWCDVNSGQVNNEGSGYIKIGGDKPAGDDEPISEGPKGYTASALELRELTANIQVEVSEVEGIEVSLNGPKDLVKAIRTHVRDNVLVVKGGASVISRNTTVVQSSINGIVISAGSTIGIQRGVISSLFKRRGTTTVFSTDTDDTDSLKITIKVPLHTPIDVDDIRGNVTIGDTDGPLIAKARLSYDVKAGRVTHAHLIAKSSGSIHVDEVSGTLQANASSSGTIRVQGNSMSSVMATASSSGNIVISGTAETAMLTASSSGDVYMQHVKQRPMQSESSSGSVKVGKVG